jgi:two-component system chemotaxis response regulator CheY
MNTLVIDDSKAMRRIVRKAVSGFGFEASEACDGQEGLDELEANPEKYGLVLVDWNMPNMNGLEFVIAVRAQSRFDSLKIVMVTSETDPEKMVKAIIAGVDEFLMKPFTQPVMAEKLQLIGVDISAKV